MNHKLFILPFLAIAVLVISAGIGAAAVFTVDDSGGAMYTSIQAAIDDASPGDEIHVDSGTYYENVVVNKQLTLRGIDTGAGMPVVDANWGGSAVTLSADGVTLERLNLINSYGFESDHKAGIMVQSSFNYICGNDASFNDIGIFIVNSGENTIMNNVVDYNFVGILLELSWGNIINLNDLIENEINANDESAGGNQWDSNYYSDYLGIDENNDGFGEEPYIIPGMAMALDFAPLVAPSLPSGPADKTLLQVEGQPDVYWLQNNKLYWVTDLDVINQMSGIPGWDSINILPANEFDPADYEPGPWFITTEFESNVLLIREQGYTEIYLIENGRKRHFTSDDAFLDNGYSFNDVIDVSEDIIAMFEPGSEIGTVGPVKNINKGNSYFIIQDAINNANPSDEIHVDSGIYYENVNVHKQLILRGIDTGAGMPVVDAGGSGSAITLSADGITLEGFKAIYSGISYSAGIKVTSSYNTINGNNVSNNNNDGIYLFKSNSNTIIDNTVSNNNDDGIYLYESCSNIIIENTVSNNNDDGIYQWSHELYFSNNTFINNIVRNNYDGMFFQGFTKSNTIKNNDIINNDYYGIKIRWAGNTILRDNRMSGNKYNFYISGLNDFQYTSNDIDTSNLVDGKPIYYLVSLSNIVIDSSSNAGTVYCIKCDNVTIIDLTLKNNSWGIYFYKTTNSKIQNNTLINNSLNAYDTGVNQWDSGTLGNYYSNYIGTDSNGDGIGDTPYPIPGGSSVDRYPLMKPCSPPSSAIQVGQGAPDTAIKELFVDAYNRNGGFYVLGNPNTEVHEMWGYLVQDFPGTLFHPGGIIMYNPNKNAAYYLHGAIWEKYYNSGDLQARLGPVTSDEQEAVPSPKGTTGRFNEFENGHIYWISDMNDDNADNSALS